MDMTLNFLSIVQSVYNPVVKSLWRV